MLVFEERGNRSIRRETSRCKDENQQQTQPIYDTESGNRTRVGWWEESDLTTAPSLLSLTLEIIELMEVSVGLFVCLFVSDHCCDRKNNCVVVLYV